MLRVIIILALCVPAFAQFPGITYSQWNDLEGCTNASAPTGTCLGTSNHVATGTWSVTNGSSYMSVQSAAQGTETGTSGTHGLQYNGNPSTANNFVTYALPSAQSTISIGLFYKTVTSCPSFTECAHTVVFNSNAFGDLTRISDERDATTNTRELRISPCNTGTSSCEVAVADNTAYWVTMKYVQNGTTSLSVYTTTYSLVGTATYAAGINNAVDNIILGSDLGALNATTTLYFDDIILDWTTATYPLLPQASTTVYVSQSGGAVSCGADGTQTTTALASVTWTAGNTYKLCGTITSQIAPSASGSAGNLITIQWESNASVQVCNTTAAVNLGSHTFMLLDLGGVSTAIECLNNGTGLGTTVDAVGINATGSNVEIRNGTIGPLYQYTCCSSDGLGSTSIQLGANSTVVLHGLSLNNANAGFVWSLGGTTSGNQMYNNTFASTVGRAIDYSNGVGSGTDTGARIHDNDITFGDGWYSGAGDFTHIESIRSFNQGSAATDSLVDVQIYNNYIHGSTRGDSTSFIFIPDGGACPSTNSSWEGKIYNNIFSLDPASSVAPGDGLVFTQDCHHTIAVYNNVMDCGSNTHGIGVEYQGTNTITMGNNVVMNCQTMFYNAASGITLTENNDFYFNTGSGQWYWQGVNKTTLSAWTTATGQGTGDSTANPGLNSNYTVTSGTSAVAGAGANLTSLAITPLDSGAPASFGTAGDCGTGCIARPSTGSWDVGAYPFQAAPATAGTSMLPGATLLQGATILQ